MTVLLTVAAAAGAAVVTMAVLSAPAHAHNRLVASEPADGATLPDLAVVRLTFAQPVDAALAQVVVTGPDGGDIGDGSVQVAGVTVTRAVIPRTAGVHLAMYQVVSGDGHPVTGSVRFTLAAPNLDGSPARPPSDSPAGVAGRLSRGGDTSWGTLTLGAVAVAALLAVFAFTRRRPNTDPGLTDP